MTGAPVDRPQLGRTHETVCLSSAELNVRIHANHRLLSGGTGAFRKATGLEARTIHRLLETDPRTGTFRRNEEIPLECDLLVVDETSMVDVPLMRALLRRATNSKRPSA